MRHDPTPALFRTQEQSVKDAPRLSAQSKLILARLREGPADEIELHSVSSSRRVAARIYELRQLGHEIVSFTSARKVGGYRLVKEAR